MEHSIERAVVITGSGSGIGAATARRLAGPGVGILVHAKDNASGVDAVQRELAAKGSVTAGLCEDLAEPGAADRIIARTMSAFGRIDALIHVAGYPVRGGFGADKASAAECFDAIPLAFYRLVTGAMASLTKAGDGRVVAVGTITPMSFAMIIRSTLSPVPRRRHSKSWCGPWPSSSRRRAPR